MARGEIAGFGGVGNRKAPASSGGGRRPSSLVRHPGLACPGAGRGSGARLSWVSREDAKTRRGRRGGQRGSRRDRRGAERRRGAGAGAGAEGPKLPSPCPRLKAGAGIGAGGGGRSHNRAYPTEPARSAASATARRALWRESQAGRMARARRLRAPTNNSRRGGGSVRPPFPCGTGWCPQNSVFHCTGAQRRKRDVESAYVRSTFVSPAVIQSKWIG